MESNFSNRDFEQFVKQNADQYRMFPSEKVWKGIHNTLHTRRKWYGFWLTLLLLSTGGAVTWVMTTYSSSKRQATSVLTGKPVAQDENVTKRISEVVAEKLEKLVPYSSPVFENPGKDNGSFPSEILRFDEIPLSMVPSAQVHEFIDIPVSAAGTEKEHTELLNSISSLVTPLTFPTISTGTAPAQSPEPDNAQPIVFNEGNAGRTPNVFLPLSIESVDNIYRHKKPAKRISWQLFVTPTISYRRLSVNKDFDNPTSGVFPLAYLSDVNSVVTHKPDLGLQIGLSGRYPLTKNIKLRGGLQFNINRYDIKAYQFNGEVARIDLNGGPGNNTINTWTYYRNYTGYKSDWLKNYYFSVSAPIGAEVKLFGGKKTSVGVASTIQPTYILSDRAYLISTDFKNYAEVPRLIRHVNLNTSFETFVNYTSGKTKWQIGPQVRYQILSSFHSKYPVKENLFDFGLKVGVTLNE